MARQTNAANGFLFYGLRNHIYKHLTGLPGREIGPTHGFHLDRTQRQIIPRENRIYEPSVVALNIAQALNGVATESVTDDTINTAGDQLQALSTVSVVCRLVPSCHSDLFRPSPDCDVQRDICIYFISMSPLWEVQNILHVQLRQSLILPRQDHRQLS
jgi:hypothetical protein